MTKAEAKRREKDLHLTPAALKRGRKKLAAFRKFCKDELDLKLEPFQELVLLAHFAGIPEIMLLVPKGNGKALDVDTPIPTPGGWSRMGDLVTGDLVLGRDGEPTRVIGTSEVMYGRPCYEFTFSDGATLVADAEHQWHVEAVGNRFKPQTRTTAELVDRGVKFANGACKWRVPTGSRAGEAVDLPIDPYVLGAWLGDGSSADGRVSTPDPEIWDRIEAAGYELGSDTGTSSGRCRCQAVLGLAKQLRDLGLHRSKHIPKAYLMASRPQRLALIQGLLDTDGTVSAAGQTTFSTTTPALRDGFRRLAWSLGRPCYLLERRAILDGVDHGPCWELTVACGSEHQLLTVPRKASRLKAVPRTADHRRIVSIEPVPSRPVKCIAVEAADRLYLAGEAMIPTHNTVLLAALAVYHMSTYPKAPEGYIGASSTKQARKMYFEAARFAKRVNLHNSPGYLDIRRVKDETEGFFRVLASDSLGAGSLEGIGPTLGLIDELHAHQNDALYGAIHGALHKAPGQMIGISTAGSNPESMLAQMRAKAKAMRRVTRSKSLTIAASKDFVMFEFACEPTADLDDLDVVKEANPASFVSKASLRRLKASPSMTESRWARYHCNVWRESDHSWLPDGVWSECGRGNRIGWPDVDDPVWVGVNFRPRGGAGAAITYLWDGPRGPLTRTEIFDPPSTRGAVGHGPVKEALREAHEAWQIVACVYDEHQFHASAKELEDEGLSMRPIKMTPAVWVPITSDLMEMIKTKQINHDSDETYARHVNAAELKDAPGGGQMIHGMVSNRVEALIALGMALWGRDRFEVSQSTFDERAAAGEALL